jgi:hypothetical protein
MTQAFEIGGVKFTSARFDVSQAQSAAIVYLLQLLRANIVTLPTTVDVTPYIERPLAHERAAATKRQRSDLRDHTVLAAPQHAPTLAPSAHLPTLRRADFRRCHFGSSVASAKGILQ